MTVYKVGDILLVPFPFTDLASSKKRPSLVLTVISSKKMPSLYVIAMITSQIESEKLLGDYLFSSWKEAGLLYASKVRLGKVVTLEETLIQKKLGELQPKDWSALKKEFKKLFFSFL